MFYVLRRLLARAHTPSSTSSRRLKKCTLHVEEMESRVVPAITAVIDPLPLTGPEGTPISLTSTVTGAAAPTYGWTVVKDSASTKLAIIRRDLKISFDRLQSKLRRIVSSKNNELYLQEAIITTRNGRYVIPIKADYKGKIPGVVHDSSSSGATLFIEPLDTVELNNAWRELQIEEEKEIKFNYKNYTTRAM